MRARITAAPGGRRGHPSAFRTTPSPLDRSDDGAPGRQPSLPATPPPASMVTNLTPHDVNATKTARSRETRPQQRSVATSARTRHLQGTVRCPRASLTDAHGARTIRRVMASTVLITDDLDGSSNAETVEFSFDGTNYSIDLARRNRAALEKALKPYIAAATEIPGRSARSRTRSSRRNEARRTGRPSRARSGVELAAVRAWAAEQGIEVSARGRIAQSVIEAYQAAQ